ncbi:MAG: acetylxylan esterase [Anaerolineae bacterium]|nr:acetylxylan esterase [Anaerolineae bacterium]
MENDPNPSVRAASRDSWSAARRKAFLERVYATLGLGRRPATLLSFEEVQERLRLNQNAYRGLHQVPLDQIVGSVGRYNDFTRTFLPLVEGDSWRWRRVAELQAEMGLPPIELYKVGDAYFVKDGNHRVSVARQFGAKTIEAYVWEYETPVGGLPADAEIDDLIVKAEYRAFLDRTRLDVSRPEQKIILTEPGMYPQLEVEVELYRDNLERIDGEPRTYEEAAAAWYDLAYTLVVDVIAESGILAQFPGRTEADLYVWVTRHRRELSERYGEQVSMRDALQRLAESQQRPGPVERVMQSVAQSVSSLVRSLTSEPAEPKEINDLSDPVPPDSPLGRLLRQMSIQHPALAYADQRGDDWRWWRGEVRGKVRELLGLRYFQSEEVQVQEGERDLISGVVRQHIALTAGDGQRIPAYLMRPLEAASPLPALLVMAGHGTIRQTAGLVHSEHRSNALALAQRGFVTLALEERGFGELDSTDHTTLDRVGRLFGRPWLGTVIDDALRALDYLQARPDVDPKRLGATGLGLGGGIALFLAALDERIRAVIAQNYLGGTASPMLIPGHGCDFVPNLHIYADISDVMRLIAPRPALYAYPRHRASTRLAQIVFDRMRPSYETFSCPDRTGFIEHDQGDSYAAELAAQWLERWLVEEEDTDVLLWAPRE